MRSSRKCDLSTEGASLGLHIVGPSGLGGSSKAPSRIPHPGDISLVLRRKHNETNALPNSTVLTFLSEKQPQRIRTFNILFTSGLQFHSSQSVFRRSQAVLALLHREHMRILGIFIFLSV